MPDIKKTIKEAINKRLTEGKKKSTTAWVRKAIGPGKTQHSGRGFYEVKYSGSFEDAVANLLAAAKRDKAKGIVDDYKINARGDLEIMLNKDYATEGYEAVRTMKEASLILIDFTG
jgi:hypothetical protein